MFIFTNLRYSIYTLMLYWICPSVKQIKYKKPFKENVIEKQCEEWGQFIDIDCYSL